MNNEDAYRRYFPRGPGLGFRAFVLALLCGGLIAADQNTTALKPTRQMLSSGLSPLLWIATLPPEAAERASNLKTRAQLELENSGLTHDNQILRAQLSTLTSLEAENLRLRELLGANSHVQQRITLADIVAINQDPYRHQITLNKGANDGVFRGQALVDAHGVMGQVVEIGATTSQALLITDPDHGIPVEISRTGLQTIAQGRGDGRSLKLPFLPSNADVRVGDLLVSSALGGRFPAGVPVGQIYDVKHTAGEHFMAAMAYPSAKLHQRRQGMLVWNDAQPITPTLESDSSVTPTSPDAASTVSASTP